MALTNLFIDDPIDPISFNGVNHADVSLVGKRMIKPQFDPLTTPSARCYFRIDEEAEAGGTTIALFKPMGFWGEEGNEEQGLWIDPALDETPYLHLLFTDGNGTAVEGGANDRLYILPFRHTED